MSAATTELSLVAETPSGPAELPRDDALELKRLLVPVPGSPPSARVASAWRSLRPLPRKAATSPFSSSRTA
jgi:hypothetical protein